MNYTSPEIDVGYLSDVYQSGDVFVVRNIEKTFSEIIFRIGEIGEPTLIIGENVIDLKRNVGFGGEVILKVERLWACLNVLMFSLATWLSGPKSFRSSSALNALLLNPVMAS